MGDPTSPHKPFRSGWFRHLSEKSFFPDSSFHFSLCPSLWVVPHSRGAVCIVGSFKNMCWMKGSLQVDSPQSRLSDPASFCLELSSFIWWIYFNSKGLLDVTYPCLLSSRVTSSRKSLTFPLQVFLLSMATAPRWISQPLNQDGPWATRTRLEIKKKKKEPDLTHFTVAISWQCWAQETPVEDTTSKVSDPPLKWTAPDWDPSSATWKLRPVPISLLVSKTASWGPEMRFWTNCGWVARGVIMPLTPGKGQGRTSPVIADI